MILMKSALIVRPVDSNGRIVIPKNLLTDIFKAKDDETCKQMEKAVAEYKIERLRAEIRRLSGEIDNT